MADVIDVPHHIRISKQEDLVQASPSLSDVMLGVGFLRKVVDHRASVTALVTMPLPPTSFQLDFTRDPEELPIETTEAPATPEEVQHQNVRSIYHRPST